MNRMIKRAGLAAGTLALGAGAYLTAAHHAEGQLRDRLMAAASHRGLVASMAGVSVNPLSGRVVVSGLKAEGKGISARIGRITHQARAVFPLVTPAQAQATSSYTMDDVEISGANSTISAEELVVEEATLDEDAMQDLFDADTLKEAMDILKGLSFKAIRSPEVVLEFKVAGGITKAHYKDVAFERMRNGRLERLAAASLSIDSTPPAGPPTKVTTGLNEIRGLDLVLTIRFFIDKAALGEALATAYESSRVENYKVSVPGIVEYTVGRWESGAMRLKPLAIPLADLVAKLPQGWAVNDPDATRTALPPLLELFNNISDDGFEARDIKVTAAGGGGAIARITGSLGGGKVPAGFKIEGVTGTGPGMSFKLASLGLEGFSAKPSIDGMIKAILAGDPDFKSVDPRTLLPRLGTYALKGLEFEAPDPTPAKGRPPGKLTGGIGLIEVAAKNEVKGIPTDLSVTFDKLTLRLPAATGNEALIQLKDLGYDAVDLTARAALKWDEPKKEIQFTDVSLGGVNMGSAKLVGAIGNVGRELFESDLAMAQVAALGATIKGVTLKIENTGLAERLFEMQGKASGRKADEVRAELGSMAALVIPAVLGPSDDAKAIGNALARFLARPKSLSLEATAKNAGGVGIPDLVTITNPQAALSLISVKASAD